jgi:uracil-DNA glycosylase
MMNYFLKLLRTPAGKQIFNPWVDVDKENDVDKTAPEKRTSNLKCYLQERTHAKYLLLAEALGYQGGHFTGIPMTSERILLGHKTNQGIDPDHVCRSPLYRTSNTKKHKDGFNEPTATIVWGKLSSEGLDTRNFVLWNAFPWHPYKKTKGLLSNRTPTNHEMMEGAQVLDALLQAFDFKKIIALGNKAEGSLRAMGIKTEKVRHPAMGGAERFREQFFNIVQG